MKRTLTVLAIITLFVSTINAQWTNEGVWPDSSYLGGTHGIAVDPDGKVWVASYYQDVVFGDDSVATSGILVFNADGTEADFSPISTIATGGGFVVDTLNGNCRGMGVDENGNILYVQTGSSKIFKIDYTDGKGLARADIADYVSHPVAPSVSDDGTIYVGNVLPGQPIATFDTDLAFLGNAVDAALGGYARTMEVSKDGLAIYWMSFSALKTYVYTRGDGFSAFELTDSTFLGMSVESSTWNPVTGNLWVSDDGRSSADSNIVAPTWYEYDPATKELVKGFESIEFSPGASDFYARGIDFSPDGTIAYVGNYQTGDPRIQKVVNGGVGVKEIGIEVPSRYELSQNYPNPFNPTTVINFSIPESGLVTVKVYNTLGQEVAELVNSVKSAGMFEVSFDASNLTSGMYIYKIQAGKFSATKKMMLLK